jgi:hypothetical protein
MKYIFAALTALSFLVCLTVITPFAQARTIRQDLPCPYGSGGDPWTFQGTAAGSPFNPGISSPNSAKLSGPITFDDIGLTTTSATQYAYYSAPIPNASTCSTTPNAPPPIAQVIDFALASGQSLGSVALPTGATELEFNYASGITGGPASFTLDGVTYRSVGSGLPLSTANNFIFNSNGTLFGGVSEDGTTVIAGALPTGWSRVTAAPEIDPASALGALMLLAGGLAILRGARRNARVPVIA